MSASSSVRTMIAATLVSCSWLGAQACTGNDSTGGGAAAGSSSGSGGQPVEQAGGGGSGSGNDCSGGSASTSSSTAGCAAGADSGATPANGASFQKRVVVDKLASPWEIIWGPDGWLWLTERSGKRVVRVRPSDGMRSVALQLDEVRQVGQQDGLLGMALHPHLLSGRGEDFVYVAYSYDAAEGRRFKIRRYTYDANAGSLGDPLDVLVGLPASTDHNSGRLQIGPDTKLYYTIGDQGENQFDRKCNPDRAQDLPTQAQISAQDFQAYQGKILRMNLDGSIPEDNPQLKGVRSHVFSLGHRNAQGIAFGPTGVLFADEQGPKSDDELNRIDAGKNYGWPFVAGYQDDQAYVYGNWSAAPDCESLAYSDYTLPASVPQQKESAWTDPSFTPPLLTFYTVKSDYMFQDPKCGGEANICWPTIAPSSLEFYSAAKHALTGWSDSLLITSLKQGTVYRVALSADGQGISGDPTPLFKTTNRYRDVAVNPDGQTFYVITDGQGSTQNMDGGATDALENKGAVLEFKAAPLDVPVSER